MVVHIRREQFRACAWGLMATAVLAALIVFGSRNLDHFDAALVGYTFATLFATFGITYRYNMWLQRPPTGMYWRRGWQVFLRPSALGRNLIQFGRRLFVEFAANRFIFRRGKLRWGAHWLIMWGCLIAAAITFPLVWGWVHFQTVPDNLEWYRVYAFGFPTIDFPVDSPIAFFTFHGLVWASWLVIIGVMLAFRRRMIDHGATAAGNVAAVAVITEERGALTRGLMAPGFPPGMPKELQGPRRTYLDAFGRSRTVEAPRRQALDGV